MQKSSFGMNNRFSDIRKTEFEFARKTIDPYPSGMDMATRIRAARKRLKLSQVEVGERMGVAQAAISKWELGDNGPNKTAMDRLAEVLEVTPAHLRYGESRIDGAGAQFDADIIGRIEAGSWREPVAQDSEPQTVHFIPHPSFSPEDQSALEVLGPSCDEIVPDGGFAIVVSLDKIPGGTDALLMRDRPALVIVERTRAGAIERTMKELRANNGHPQLCSRSNHPDHQASMNLSAEQGDDPTSITFVVVEVIHRVF